MNPESTWLTRQELAERTKVPASTLAQWATRGQGPAYAKFGRHVRYRLADVLAWEQAAFTPAASA
jgi:excisionase family DNA binding protein